MNAKLFPSLAAALLAAACASQPKELPPKPFAATRWQLAMEVPFSGEQPFVRFGDGRVEGFGGCNKFAARYVQDSVGARAIAIGRLEINRRLCDPGPQSAESRFLEVFQSVSSYSITTDVMTMSGSGGTLRFVAMDTVAPPLQAARSSGELSGTRWNGVVDPKLDPNATPWMEFTPGRISGFTGCNLFNGTWRVDGAQMRLGPIMMTKRGCVGPEADVERRVLAVLNEQGQITLEGGKLVVSGPRGDRFEFIPVAAVPQ